MSSHLNVDWDALAAANSQTSEVSHQLSATKPGEEAVGHSALLSLVPEAADFLSALSQARNLHLAAAHQLGSFFHDATLQLSHFDSTTRAAESTSAHSFGR